MQEAPVFWGHVNRCRIGRRLRPYFSSSSGVNRGRLDSVCQGANAEQREARNERGVD